MGKVMRDDRVKRVEQCHAFEAPVSIRAEGGNFTVVCHDRLSLPSVRRPSPVHLFRSPLDLLDARLRIPEHLSHAHIAAHRLRVMDAVLVCSPFQECVSQHVRCQVEPLVRR